MSVNSRLKATKIIGQRKAFCNIPRHWNAGLVSSRARLTSWGEGALVHDSYLPFSAALILRGHSTLMVFQFHLQLDSPIFYLEVNNLWVVSLDKFLILGRYSLLEADLQCFTSLCLPILNKKQNRISLKKSKQVGGRGRHCWDCGGGRGYAFFRFITLLLEIQGRWNLHTSL